MQKVLIQNIFLFESQHAWDEFMHECSHFMLDCAQYKRKNLYMRVSLPREFAAFFSNQFLI